MQTSISHDERKWEGNTASEGSHAVFGNGDISNTVVNGNYVINLVTGEIDIQKDLPANFSLRRSQTADQKGSALLVAAQQGRAEIVQQLLEDGANWKHTESDEQTALFKAVSAGHLEVVDVLLSAKERQSYLVSHPERQWLDTPLHRAAVNGRPNIVRKLLACHCPLESIQREGFTALQLAAGQGKALICKLLIEAGANVYHENNNRATALHSAARNGWLEALNTFLQKDSNANFLEHRNKAGETALSLAVTRKHDNCTQSLIQYGASVHTVNNDQCNLLHLAVRVGMPDLVESLLPKFSLEEVNARNRWGHTPLQIAQNERKPKCIGLLRTRLTQG